jgi:hypothetical protein
MSTQDASQKVASFMAKYGEKGFLTLYFSNYLFELVMSYVRSESDAKSKDSAYQFHLNKNDRPRSVKQDEEFRQALRIECDKKASKIVANLEKRGLLPRFSEDIDRITAETKQEVDSALKETFEKVLKAKWEATE